MGTGEEASVADTGESVFVSQLDVIERVIAFTCRRHRLSSTEADDFASHVKLRLIENDYAILRRFQGRSSVRTYLTVVIQRLFLDYRVKAWGKWRPSAEARRRGPVAVLLERLIVREGHSFEEAYELLKTNHGVEEERAALERLASRFPERTKRRFEADDALADLPSPERPPDAAVAERDSQQAAERLSKALGALMSSLETQDRLVLAMRFEDGRTVAEIAATLRLDQKRLYRRVDKLLRDLRAGLEAAGLDAATVADVLESPAATVELDPAARGTGGRRPSIEEGARQWR